MDSRATPPSQVTAASALGSLAAARALVASLDPLGIPLLVLKGPPLQLRLLGSDCAYQSADIDLLVPAGEARRVRRRMREQGWEFLPENGVLWWVDRAAAFTRGGVTVDLHWGVHAYTLGALRFRSLERALWRDATRSPEGWLEPLPEPLVVYLAVNWAGHHYDDGHRLTLVRAAAALVTDWPRAREIARTARVTAILEAALHRSAGNPEVETPPLAGAQVSGITSRALARARVQRPEALRRALLNVRYRPVTARPRKNGERRLRKRRS